MHAGPQHIRADYLIGSFTRLSGQMPGTKNTGWRRSSVHLICRRKVKSFFALSFLLPPQSTLLGEPRSPCTVAISLCAVGSTVPRLSPLAPPQATERPHQRLVQATGPTHLPLGPGLLSLGWVWFYFVGMRDLTSGLTHPEPSSGSHFLSPGSPQTLRPLSSPGIHGACRPQRTQAVLIPTIFKETQEPGAANTEEGTESLAVLSPLPSPALSARHRGDCTQGVCRHTGPHRVGGSSDFIRAHRNHGLGGHMAKTLSPGLLHRGFEMASQGELMTHTHRSTSLALS